MTTLVHAPSFRQADYIAMVEEASKEAPQLTTRIVLDNLTPNPSPSQGEGSKSNLKPSHSKGEGSKSYLIPNPSPSQGEGSESNLKPSHSKGEGSKSYLTRGLTLSWSDLKDLASKTTVDQLRIRESILQLDDPIH